MHWSGQVAIFFCLLSWVATVPLVAKLMTIRNEWSNKVTALTVSNNEKDGEIATLEQKRRELLDALDVTKRSWGYMADGIEVFNPIRATGAMGVDFGTDAGLGAPNPDKLPILVHVFRPQESADVKQVGRRVTFHTEDVVGGAASGAKTDVLTGSVSKVEDAAGRLTVDVEDEDGNIAEYVVPVDAVLGYEYLGEFDAAPSPMNSQLTPNWLIRPDDATRNFPNDQALLKEYRIRERAPVAYSGPIADMQSQLHYNDTLHDERQAFRDTAQKNVDRHQAQLDKQNAELVDPQGLQQQLIDAQRTRNEALARLDDLRRRIDSAYTEQQALVAEVQSLAGELPGAKN